MLRVCEISNISPLQHAEPINKFFLKRLISLRGVFGETAKYSVCDKETNSYKYYSQKFSFFKEDVTDKSDIFLIKYKGFKINDFPLPNNFDKMNLKEKSIILEDNANFIKYTLNERNIELIYLINELRENNNLNKLICNKIENLND